eukprot:s164_g6.t1
MGAVKLDHSDPAQHRAGIMQHLRQFWIEDQLCDVVLRSHDGAEHRAHTAVLSAASAFFKNLLGGSFLEAERVQQKQPVELAASKVAVSALLDYIYDGQPEVPVEVGLELLRLAEAYDLPKLAGAIEAGILACLDSSVALQVLQEAHGLHSLRVACEDKVAEDFETCSQHPDFGKLSVSGPSGDDLHREVEDALTSRERTQSPGTFQSKRRRLQHWSPFFGASTTSIEASGREVLPFPSVSLRWHQGELFVAQGARILSWKPGDPATCVRPVAGEGAAVTGINDLGSSCRLSISPSGEMVVSDWENDRLVRFQNGCGDLVVGNTDATALFFSPSGVLYSLSQNGRTVAKVVGSTLETVIASESLPADKQFDAFRVFVTKEEVIYVADYQNGRILCINLAESLEPVVVCQIETEGPSFLIDLFVTDGGTVYLAEWFQRKVLAFHPSSTTFTEILQCPDGLHPAALLVQARSLYVSMGSEDPSAPKVLAAAGLLLPCITASLPNDVLLPLRLALEQVALLLTLLAVYVIGQRQLSISCCGMRNGHYLRHRQKLWENQGQREVAMPVSEELLEVTDATLSAMPERGADTSAWFSSKPLRCQRHVARQVETIELLARTKDCGDG